MRRYEEPNPLELDTRKKLYTIISSNPGLHFRELQRQSGFAVGALQYHLGELDKGHLIKVEKDKRFVRYYAVVAGGFDETKDVISFLRQDKPREILLELYKKNGLSQQKIARKIELGLSTTSWHLNNLVDAGLIERKRRGRRSLFYLVDKEKVKQVLLAHKDSFIDLLTERFADIINDLHV